MAGNFPLSIIHYPFGQRLSKIRHGILLVLIALLPFHALFVTVGTKLLLGPGHPPLFALAVWKELLLAVFFVTAGMELYAKKKSLKIDAVGGVMIALLVLSLIVSITHSALFTPYYLYGFKYLFLPLLFFLVCTLLPWEKGFLVQKVTPLLLFVSSIVIVFGTLSYFLPQEFFVKLGYLDAHSLYSPSTPLSAFQYISGASIRRMQSTFAGPNQFGLWLLLPWSIACSGVFQKQEDRKQNILFLLFIGGALFLTFSRSAWIAAFAIFVVALSFTLRGKQRRKVLTQIVLLVASLGTLLALAKPELFLRGISNEHHLMRLQEGIRVMMHEPVGRGLGSAGPASNHLKDPCVYFPDGADTSWARERDDLCIFVGGAQVQPFVYKKICDCAFLPENWYLQVGVELGVVGFLLFIALIVVILRSLLTTDYQLLTFLPFLGISIAALFLHAWEDSAVAYTVWGITGIALAKGNTSSWFKQILRRFRRGIME
jgi:O-antigen ligase